MTINHHRKDLDSGKKEKTYIRDSKVECENAQTNIYLNKLI